MRVRSILIALTIVVVGSSIAYAAVRDFNLRNDGGSRIQFVSDAPLETITGVSSHVTGQLRFDPANLAATTGTVRVRVDSIRTGVDLRDEHLRGASWLDAARFPEATFEVRGIDGVRALTPNQTHNATVRGRFTIHGVTRDVRATAQVRLVPVTDQMRANHVTSDALRVQANFRVNLTQYNVSVPAVVRLKVSDEIDVNVTLRATAEAAPAQAAAPQAAPES